MWNGCPIKILGGTEVEIKDKKYSITPSIRKVLVNTSYDTAKSMNDKDEVFFKDILQKNKYYNHKSTKGSISGRDKYNKNILDKDVRRNLNLGTKLDGRGIEKNIIPSNVIDIYTRLAVLLRLKLSGQIDTLR